MKLMLNGDVQYITVIIYCGYKSQTIHGFLESNFPTESSD